MKKITKLLTLLSVLGIISSCTVVGPGERGVRVTFGKVNEKPLEPDVYFVFPLVSSVRKISVQTQKADIEKSEAVALGNQQVEVHIAVNYQVDPENVVKIVSEFGDEDTAVERVLYPAVHEVLKKSTSKRTLDEVLSKRQELKDEIDNDLIERLAKYNIKVRDVSIVNLTFSREYTQSVEQKMVAEQEAKRALYLAEKAKNESQALVNTAKGQAEAQALLRSSITPMLLQKMAIEKWNGVLPTVIGSGGTPLLDLKNLKQGQ